MGRKATGLCYEDGRAAEGDRSLRCARPFVIAGLIQYRESVEIIGNIPAPGVPKVLVETQIVRKIFSATFMFVSLLSLFACKPTIIGGKKIENGAAADYFSTSYKEARKKFLEASQDVGASLETFNNPYTSPKGDPLFTDVALVGPKNAKAILVLVSGTHGVEGFAGSGIQTGLLREGIGSRLKPNMCIVMIHALNPYGFSHLRRFNEDNVDLNRNFLDHSKPYPRNPGYAELEDAITPKSLSMWTNAKARLRFLYYRIKNGKLKLKEAISRGQFTHPQGLFYDGHSEAWSNETIRKIASRYLSQA